MAYKAGGHVLSKSIGAMQETNGPLSIPPICIHKWEDNENDNKGTKNNGTRAQTSGSTVAAA